jgi:hypothetical protein
LALALHSDALVVGRGRLSENKVPFEPFIGVGPRRFGALFVYTTRRDKDGALLAFDRMTAAARIEDRDPEDLRSDMLPYLRRERHAEGILAETEEATGFKMKREVSG